MIVRFLAYENALQLRDIKYANSYFAKEIGKTKIPQFFILDEKDRFRDGNGIYHLYSKPLPEGALDYENGIVSIELMFMQLAQVYTLKQCIILGCLLCACSNGPQSPVIIEKQRLVDFAREAVGYPGRRKALQALKYVKERAVSIMEIFVHLLIGLPNHLGGLGIEGGVFNGAVELNADGKKALGMRYCFLDYSFPELKICIEYQGEHHNSCVDYDSVRFTALEEMGYKIIIITKSQLYNSDRRAQLVKLILKLFNRKQRVRTSKYILEYDNTWKMLPRIDNKNQASLKVGNMPSERQWNSYY